MEPYDASIIPMPFGLYNTGAICHFNALMQALLSCSSFLRAVQENPEAMRRTGTGAALFEFVGAARAAAPGQVLSAEPLLRALMGDLRRRRPGTRFGNSQESASEGLVLLLEMIEDCADPLCPGCADCINPVVELFHHRYDCAVKCGACGFASWGASDVSHQFNTWDFAGRPPETSQELAGQLFRRREKVEGYRCEKCGAVGPATRHTILRMIPEIAVLAINRYGNVGHGGATDIPATLPARFDIPLDGHSSAHGGARGGARMVFALSAAVEHTGSLSGGHYTARAVRRNTGGRPLARYAFNDTSHNLIGNLQVSPRTYLAFYNYVRDEA